MTICFVDESWEDYLYWQKVDKKMLTRINKIIKNITKTPYEYIGKPEPLKHRYQGYWSRRIDAENRLIYKVVEQELWIVKCRFHYDR